MTDLAHLPPLPPLASRGADQDGPTVFPSKQGEDPVAGRIDLAQLPPLRPNALGRTKKASTKKASTKKASSTQAGPTVFPSKQGEDLVAAITVLMAGLVALAWALRLDTSGGQVLVAAATSFTLLAPAVTCTILRSAIRHARLQ
jgi:hypothetical protein